jgi:hypothetical protein
MAAPQALSRPFAAPRAAVVFSIIHLSLQWRIDFVLGLAFWPVHQCLRHSSSGSLSLASGFNASGSLSQAWPNTPLHSCASMPKGLTSLVSVTMMVNASPRVSESLGLPHRICKEPKADPPDSPGLLQASWASLGVQGRDL